MKKLIISSFLALSVISTAVSCRRDEAETIVAPVKINDVEIISEVRLNIKDDTGKVTTVSYLSASSNNPEITLLKDKVYSLDLQVFKDKSDNTKEIIDEKEEHFFSYEFADINASLKRDAKDEIRKDGTKIGLRTNLTLLEAPKATSVMKIKLLHKPSSVSVAGTDERGSAIGGGTDFNITFKIK